MAGFNWKRPTCHAWAKSQKRPCFRKVGLRRNGSLHVVCPSHGSKTPPYSERPISEAGKQRISAAAKAMWKTYRERKSAGLPVWQVGRPKLQATSPSPSVGFAPEQRRQRIVSDPRRRFPDRGF
jgi:hypothetical protein